MLIRQIGDSMLKIENVTKKYGKNLANDNLSLTVEPGQITILLGPNGAGKSTLIKSIAGLLRYEGKIEICGYPAKSIQAKQNLGYIPELPAVYELLTVSEHIQFVERAWNVEHDEAYVRTLLERLEMTDKVDKLGKELSKGMQQKLSIICALVHKPQVLVFDEPLIGLDPHAIKQLKMMFEELRDEGRTILISTHMIESIENEWDIAHILMNGKMKATVQNNKDENSNKSLESLFFEITEGEAK